jgi:hypothetical protein
MEAIEQGVFGGFMIQTVDPKSIRMQTTAPTTTSSHAAGDFSAFMSSAAPASAEAVAWNTGSANSANITHAAVTGMAGGSQAYAYPGAVGTGGTGVSYGGGVYGGVPATGAYGPATGGGTTLPYGPGGASGMDMASMMGAIQGMNKEMLQIQTLVQQEGRQFMTMSNVDKARWEMMRNTVNNMK